MESLIMIVLMFAVMWLLLIRPEKKRKQKAEEMRNGVKKGDVITSIGGIVGKVVKVNDDTIIVETSEDRVRVELTKWAISSVGVQTGEVAENKKEKKAKEEALPEEPEAPAETEEN